MLSTNAKEIKAANKAQKKVQKSSKKQQVPQQKPIPKSDNNKNSKNTINTIPESKLVSSNGTNKLTSQQKSQTETLQRNNSNNNNNNNSTNDANYNNNVCQKLREQLEAERRLAAERNVTPGCEDAPKFERSNSFSLKNTFSKLFNSITGSKENLSKLDDDAKPYTFTRSRSMILLRRSNRRSFIEPQLEQLSEEVEKSGDHLSPAVSPRKNSVETADSTDNSNILHTPEVNPRQSVTSARVSADFKTPHRPNSQLYTSTPFQEHDVKLQRQPSTVSLAPGEGNGVPYNPQLQFQKRRSNTLLSSFRNTINTLTGEKKKKEKLNPKWSASLQSLQAIDNMVSYENMSFIDYDKFNGYEKQLEKQLSTLSLMDNQQEPNCTEQTPHTAGATRLAKAPSTISLSLPSPQPTPQTVVRRRKTSSSAARSPLLAGDRNSVRSGSFNFHNDYNHNLDELRNVYRDSLDSRKLERLNDLSRDLFALDREKIVDILNLEDGSVGKRKAMCRMQSIPATDRADAADAGGVVQVSQTVIKSK